MSNEKLTLDLISKSHEKFANIKIIEVELNIEDEVKTVELEMHKHFDPVGVRECVMEFIRNMDFARKADRNGFGDISEPYLLWLLIKHFTELGESMPTVFNEQLESLRQMMNTSVYFQIISHFEEEEIRLIKEEIEVTLVTFEENGNYLREFRDEYRKKLNNKSLLD